MVIDTELNPLTVEEARRLRQQAGELLARLTAECEQSERRHAEAGKRDPMKFITGRTSLDSAVASVREMICNMDTLLARLEGELESVPSGSRSSARTNGRPHQRPAVRSLKTGSLATPAHTYHGPDLQ